MVKSSLAIAAVLICLICVSAPAAWAGEGGPQIGVYLQELSDDLREYYDYKGMGVLVSDVVEDTGAEKAGLRAKDIMLSIDDKVIETIADVRKAIDDANIGDVVDVKVLRAAIERTLPVELTARRKSKHPLGHKWFYFPESDRPWIGIQIEDLNPQLASYFGVKSGILVEKVFEESPAEKAKLLAGDIVIAWEKEKLEDSDSFFEQLDKAEPGDKIRLTVMRKGKKKKINLVLGEPVKDKSKLFGYFPDDPPHPLDPEKGMRVPMLKKLPLPYCDEELIVDAEKISELVESKLKPLEKKLEALGEEIERIVEKLEETYASEAE